MSDEHLEFDVQTPGAVRLDKFLVVHLPDFSRSRLQGLIRDGFVAVNGRRVVKASQALQAGDAVQIRNRVIDLFEAAALSDDPWARKRLLTFVVVGAGHAGTELMAALEELTRGILLRHYPSIPKDSVRLVLVGSAVLPQTATNLAAYAKDQLLGRGIELETSRAGKVTEEGLTLQDGRLIPSAFFSALRNSPCSTS